MLVIAAALACQTFARELAAADKTFAGACPLPIEDRPLGELSRALQAYRDIADKYGKSTTIQQRIGAALIESGKYAAAVNASPAGSPEKKRAVELMALANRFEKSLKRKVAEVVPEPGRPRYLVLSIGPGTNDNQDPDGHGDADRLSYIEALPGGQPVTLDSRPITCDFIPAGCKIYLTPLQDGGPIGAILYRAMSSDADRSDMVVFTFGAKKLTQVGEFYASGGSQLHPADKRHGLSVTIAPTWKVDWTDAYEWSNDAFKFANAKRADLLIGNAPLSVPPATGDDVTFVDWMTYAAQMDILGKFATAKKGWLQAAKLCRAAAKSDSDDLRRLQGFYGSAQGNLKEIQQRIAWINRHDYGHALLYRPYDSGLCTPPFTLGDAGR